jgi:hypothetical protein
MKIGTRIETAEGWRGKIRRFDECRAYALIEWSYCGKLPTDICTWFSVGDLTERKPQPRIKPGLKAVR